MIKSNELRVGNWYNEFGLPKQADGLLIVKLLQIEVAGKVPIDISPIPLTAETLLKSGFKKYGGDEPDAEYHWTNYRTEANWFISHCNRDDDRVPVKGGLFYWGEYPSVPVQFVHQLQNLYFAITHEELQITF